MGTETLIFHPKFFAKVKSVAITVQENAEWSTFQYMLLIFKQLDM